MEVRLAILGQQDSFTSVKGRELTRRQGLHPGHGLAAQGMECYLA